MNLNEVKKHVIFQSILYILIGICFLLSIFVILTTDVSASEMKQYNISQTIKGTNSGASWGTYSGCLAGVSSVPCWTKNINTSYNESFNQIEMNIATNTWYQNAPSTIEIYNSSNSFVNTSYSCLLTASNSSNNIPCSVVYVNSGRIIVNFNTNLYSPQTLTIYTTNQNYLNNDYININKVMLLETVDSANSDVISNANQNTSDIINNANTNTQDIIDNQNSNTQETNNVIYNSTHKLFESLNNMCPNFLNAPYIDTTFRGVRFKANIDELGVVQNYIVTGDLGSYNNSYATIWNGEFKQGMKIKVFWENCGTAKVYPQIYYKVGAMSNVLGFANTEYTINSNYPDGYIALYVDKSNATSYNCKVSVSMTYTTLNNYCAYGSAYSSKLDGIEGAIQGGLSNVDSSIQDVNDTMQDVKDIQQDTYDYMTDDTNPNVDSNAIQNTISSVQTTNPLSYLLTLPTNLLTAILNGLSSDSCQDFEIGKFGHVGRHDLGTYTFKFPCINVKDKLGDNLYNTIDIFVSVGILVITIVKLYNTISSYLTLGAEDEVKAHSHFLTPMDFLGNILGGNISGVGNSLSSMNGGGNW